MRTVLVLLLCLGLAGCAGAQIRSTFSPTISEKNPVLGVVSDNLLADALNVELLGYGFRMIERTRIKSLMDELDLNESNILAEKNLKEFGKILNIDGLIFVSGTIDFYSHTVGSASVRIVEIETGEVLAAVNFQNAWGGMQGSICDRVMKKSIPTTARIIAKKLAKSFGKL